MSSTEVLESINKQIDDGVDKTTLLKLRRRLYRLSDDKLSTEEIVEKHILLKCIKDFLEGKE